MTGLTSLGEGCLYVRRIVGFVEVVEVAADASGRCAGELPAYVASEAIKRGMGASKGEARQLQVIKLGSQPVVHAVALGAVSRELELGVIRLGGLKVLGMATVAVGRHGGVVTQRTIPMTLVAFDRSVRA